MQVVFGGLGLTVAIVALVITYFAWIHPQSSNDSGGVTPGPPTATIPAGITATPDGTATTAGGVPAAQPTATGQQVALTGLTPAVGGSNIHKQGGDLTMPCASGSASDRQRTVEYELAGRYVNLSATLVVAKAPDSDAALQVKILTDEQQAKSVVLTSGKPEPVNVALDGKQSLEIQLTCQSPDSAITISAPTLTHA
jgi:hypothetical protein